MDIDHPIYNLRFDGLVSDDTDLLHADSAVTFTIEGTDAANTELTRFGSWQIGLQAPRTHTISLDLTGNVGMMTLTAAGYSSTYAQFPVALTFSGITANAPRALDFSVLRFIAVFLALLTLYGLRPASGLWHRRWLAGNVRPRRSRRAGLGAGRLCGGRAFLGAEQHRPCHERLQHRVLGRQKAPSALSTSSTARWPTVC